ncbi:hypothetical protein D3C71_1788780 [compost metagenome]
MKELSIEDMAFVGGHGAKDIKVEISTDKVGVEGTLGDFADLAVQYSQVAPLSGLGVAGLIIKALG